MSMKKPRVLVTHWVHQSVMEFLQQYFEVDANPTRATWPQSEVLRRAKTCDAIMVFMPDSVDQRFLLECPSLRIVAAALKGPDNFDIDACTRHGVWFTLVPDLLTVPTAELGVALLLGLTRRVLEGDDHVRSGQFKGWRPELYGRGLAGRTAGIIGMGAVGRALVERLSAFGLRFVYVDPVEAALPPTVAARRASVAEVIAQSDFLFPLTHLMPETYHLINASTLASMPKGAFLVNIGRGSLVDEAAVAAALANGHLAGYAADVFEMEDWALVDRRREVFPALLADRGRTLFTPHIGSAVDEVREAIAMEAACNIVDAFEGRRPRGAQNDVLPASGVAQAAV